MTLHRADVEFVVCAKPAGGEVEVFDLRTTPARRIELEDLRPRRLKKRRQPMVF